MMKGQRNVRVVVGEDDYLVREMVKGLLEDMGYIVVGEAATGLEALELTRSQQPDVVLMDIQMPEMDGIEAAERIHEHCPTPVVVLTAYETPELLRLASEAGVGAYLVKPPNAQDMERAITIAIARFEDMRELDRLNKDLQARNEELDAFAQTVAHGLKNPLTIITGLAEVLKKHGAGMSVDEIRECAIDIEKAGRTMSRTTQQLLLLARARKTEVRVEPLDMGRIVSEARRRVSNMIEEYQAEVIAPTSWPMAMGYGPWIEEVWVNYLSNAIKYGNRPPRVEVGGAVQPGGDVCFWVRDNAPVLPLKDQARLFTPFTRLSHNSEGYGLGLSIVRCIVEKLGGQVGVQTEPANPGNTFTFTLPGAIS
jgi:two-component system sensor histidine kinase/response regulator